MNGFRGSLSRFSAVAIALAICGGANAAAQVVPPGHESHLAGLVGDAPFPGDLRLEAIEAGPERVRYRFAGAGGAQMTLSLGPPGGPGIAQTPNFAVELEDVRGLRNAEAGALAAELVERIRRRDDVPVWAVPSDASPREVDSDDGSRMAPVAVTAAVSSLLASMFLLVAFIRQKPDAARVRATAGAIVVSAIALSVVIAWTWMVDDALISFRYARNLVDGYGLVFNPGERVEGFTHPAWLFLLVPGALLESPYLWAAFVGVACSAYLLRRLWTICRMQRVGLSGFAFAAAVLFTSDAFLQFSTSGLENSLTHALIATAIGMILGKRIGAIGLVAALLALSRPDAALYGLGAVAAAIPIAGGARPFLRRAWPGLVAGAVVLLGWELFSLVYYGFPLPNTWYAKTGGAPLASTASAGAFYLRDFIRYEPFAAVALVAGLVLGLRGRNDSVKPLRPFAIAAAVHVTYVVLIGGDYMRGRFLTADVLVAVVVLTGSLPHVVGARLARWAPIVVVLSAAHLAFAPRDDNHWVTNERMFHPPNHLVNDPPLDDTAHRIVYASDGQMRRVSISGAVMSEPFHSDDRLVWLDGWGLVDPYIARCPPQQETRAGHINRWIPTAYFRARGDVRQLDDGKQRLYRADPELFEEVEAMRADPGWPSPAHERRFEEIRALTSAPVFDGERLSLIGSYLFSRRPLPPVAPEATFSPYPARGRP